MSALAKSPTAVPWQFFAVHRDSPFPFFLDRSGERISFAGSRPREQLVVDADASVRLWRDGTWHLNRRTSVDANPQDDPLKQIAAFVDRGLARPRELPSWLDGVVLPRTVGFLAYELGRWADGPKLWRTAQGDPKSSRSLGTPLAVLSTYDEIDAWNPHCGRSERIRFVDQPEDGGGAGLPEPVGNWTETTRCSYQAGFARIRDAITSGDIYQANLSRRAVFQLGESAADAYARLREIQPVPWGAFLDFGGFALLSNSPECFLERQGERIRTQPIKGTRPRHGDEALDAAEREALVRDPKEMAEHLMIVDLERNDLGRVARTGSVDVTRLAAVESFATVHHMVSDVQALLREGVGLAELLRATFPGGSITGAPKIRAMEILSDVEDVERGPYTGAIGFFNGEEQIELSIAIRTAVASGGRAVYSSGGGIVADSDPDREWDETELKLAALRRALAASPNRDTAEDAASPAAGAKS